MKLILIENIKNRKKQVFKYVFIIFLNEKILIVV